MKGIACAGCYDIRALPREDLEPVTCRCGNVTGWWLEGRRGVARYTAKHPASAWGIGFSNSFLRMVFRGHGTVPTAKQMRDFHDTATAAPGYLFDKLRYGCWAILFKPDGPAGVAWASDEERAAVGLEPYPPGHALAPKDEGADSPS